MTRRPPLRAVDPAIYEKQSQQIYRKAREEAEQRYPPRGDQEVRKRWESFRERKDRTLHERRMFVAKYNPEKWADPWMDLRELWSPVHPTHWIGNLPDEDPISSPDLALMLPGDLVVVMRLPFEGQAPKDDPFEGRCKLVGVWYVVRRQTQWFAEGPRRPSTVIWHLPLVKFEEGDAVDVGSLRALDPQGVGAIAPFTTRNWSVVACASANEAARLAAACSLPSEVLTTPDLTRLAGRLANRRCGMKSEHRKYWKDIQFKHSVRSTMEETAVRVAEERLSRDGWAIDGSVQRVPGWGGDLDCWRGANGRILERLCVEVKGTRYLGWRGKVHLQPSQYARAQRTADDQPLANERGYRWELYVQPGIPVDHSPVDDGHLPPLEIWDAGTVQRLWRPSWVAR